MKRLFSKFCLFNEYFARYVRREKEILVTKMEVTESEAERFKNRSSFLEKQLDETRTCLEEERTKNHSSVLSLEKHQVGSGKIIFHHVYIDALFLLLSDETAIYLWFCKV